MEIHNFIPDFTATSYEFYKFFENNSYDRILGLSGSIDLAKIPKLTKIAPIVKIITTSEAVKLGLVSSFTIYNVPLEFTESELEEYNKLSAKIEAANMYNKVNWKYVQQRRNLLAMADAKFKATLEMLPYFRDSKGILFSEFQESADKLTKDIGLKCISYHSGLSKKEREKNFQLYLAKIGQVKYISTVKALNEGANIPDLQFSIILSSSSKERELIQRLGRIIRVEEHKNAILVRFYIKNSQEQKWITKAQSGFMVEDLESLEQLKSIL